MRISAWFRALAALMLAGMGITMAPGAGAQEPPPTTGFEDRNGASFTTHQEELSFLAAVDSLSDRVSIEVIGQTLQGRPLHLVRVGHPAPRDAAAAQDEPVVLYVCTQHGNEPAGREACLQALRDFAFTTDPVLVSQLASMTFLFIPTANPDGRQANSRGNSQGVDINRDHLNLRTREAQVSAAVVRDWKPDLSIDHHEYGPSEPVLYDDDILYLWPRNLNVEKSVHDLARSFALDKVEPCTAAAGYTSDEYGLEAVGDVDVRQIAGDQDEGIMRNTMGLKHSLGILIETAVSMSDNPQQIPSEIGNTAAQNRRRVASHRAVIGCSLEFMRERGAEVKAATDTAPLRKEGEGLAQNVPVYFGGADNQAPPASEVVYPPPCSYRLTAAQGASTQNVFALHGVQAFPNEDGTLRVPMGQAAEPLVPLLLDAKGDRREIVAAPVNAPPLDDSCGLPREDGGGVPMAAGAPLALGGLAAMGARLWRRRRP